jgi:hypothetical protein
VDYQAAVFGPPGYASVTGVIHVDGISTDDGFGCGGIIQAEFGFCSVTGSYTVIGSPGLYDLRIYALVGDPSDLAFSYHEGEVTFTIIPLE